MNKQERVAEAIKKVVTTMMDRVMVRVLEEDPFMKEQHHATKPLYAALVPDEIFKGSHFERRFVTPFGKVWENLAQVVAIEAHGKCLVGHTINGNINIGRLRRIQETLNRLERGTNGIEEIKPNWEKELQYILRGKGGLIPVSVTCDIFIENEQTGEKYAFELDEPSLSDKSSKISKEKMLKLMAMQPLQISNVFYAFISNTFEHKEQANSSFPLHWFNMQTDKLVMIGDEFWDFLGGKGTYSNILKEINLLGEDYKERIYRDFFKVQIVQ